MDILLTIVSFVAGAVVSWLFARQSSKELKQMNAELRADNTALRKDSTEVKRLIEKLPTEFQLALANDSRTTLTAHQVQELSRTVIELQEHQQARKLTAEQREALVHSLAGIPPQQIDVFGSPSNPESMGFAYQIDGAFQSAGWPTEIRTAVHADVVEGIHIVYLTSHQQETSSSQLGLVNALIGAFTKAGLSATATPLREAPKQATIRVVVGRKSHAAS